MSMFNKLRAWWTFKHNSGHRGQRRYLLDAAGLLATRKGGGRISPSDQAQLLQRLARFVKKEQIELAVVFEGKPLREVKNGRFENLRVHFAPQGARVGELILREAKRGMQDSAVTVITADRDTEKRAGELGAATMRTATLKKGLDSVSGEARDSVAGPQRRGQRRRRRPSRDEGSSRDNRGGDRKQDAEESNDAAVRDLLDLVE